MGQDSGCSVSLQLLGKISLELEKCYEVLRISKIEVRFEDDEDVLSNMSTRERSKLLLLNRRVKS